MFLPFVLLDDVGRVHCYPSGRAGFRSIAPAAHHFRWEVGRRAAGKRGLELDRDDIWEIAARPFALAPSLLLPGLLSGLVVETDAEQLFDGGATARR